MDNYLLGEQSGLNKKIVTVAILFLMSLAVALTPFVAVFGQNTNLGVEILQVAPITSSTIVTGQSQYNGTVVKPSILKEQFIRVMARTR